MPASSCSGACFRSNSQVAAWSLSRRCAKAQRQASGTDGCPEQRDKCLSTSMGYVSLPGASWLQTKHRAVSAVLCVIRLLSVLRKHVGAVRR